MQGQRADPMSGIRMRCEIHNESIKSIKICRKQSKASSQHCWSQTYLNLKHWPWDKFLSSSKFMSKQVHPSKRQRWQRFNTNIPFQSGKQERRKEVCIPSANPSKLQETIAPSPSAHSFWSYWGGFVCGVAGFWEGGKVWVLRAADRRLLACWKNSSSTYPSILHHQNKQRNKQI